ncbi:transglutaminase domain-containing protein [Akkermansiaceae bacterium]|nr:transglutaminase domain-containing protein [Akkermansiaceae bacterium]
MEKTVQPPPRLLLGAALLFWGAMTGRPLMGLIVALIVEGANWIRFRWDFNTTACSRAWRISIALTAITGVLIWLDGDRYTALPKLITWFPLLFLPLQFVQSYGLSDRIPLNSLSFFAHLHRERNRRLGLGDSVIHFNFGNPYFVTAAIAASLGTYAQQAAFLPGLIILGGWLVFSRVKARPFALAAIIVIAGLLGLGGQLGMERLYRWATDRDMPGGYPRTDPTVSRTSIGSLGRIKQSPDMLWRLTPLNDNAPPRLLRLASYNSYKRISWQNELPDELLETLEEDGNDFRNLPTLELEPGIPHFLMREKMTGTDILKSMPSFRLRGASQSEAPIPLPGSASSLLHFELDDIEINPLGTVRVFPKRSIIDGTVRWGDRIAPESPPWPKQDLAVNSKEIDAIRQTADALGLRELPTTAAKTARIRKWFEEEFTYTRYLTIGPARMAKPTAITIFLTNGKRGHCEYFATAATLLLREAGVPARYCVGYAVMEKDNDRGEFVIRGTHGHAWTRVWDAETAAWTDFDPTPPGWLAMETSRESGSMWLADAFQRFQEDFFLWRNRPANRLGATIVMWLLGGGVLSFIVRRLWRSKLLVGGNAPARAAAGARTPLHDLEKQARRILGPRPPGVTFAHWLSRLAGLGLPAADLEEAIRLHQRLRFDPTPPPAAAQSRLQALAAALAPTLKRAKRRSHKAQSQQGHA